MNEKALALKQARVAVRQAQKEAHAAQKRLEEALAVQAKLTAPTLEEIGKWPKLIDHMTTHDKRGTYKND